MERIFKDITMIIAKNLDSLYKKHKDEIDKIVARNQNRPVGFDELEFAFLDLNGKKYYSFPESTAIPMVRLGKLEEYRVLMSSGLHNGVVTEITEQMEKILGGIVNTGLDVEVKKHSSKNIANLGMLITELRERSKTFVPVELMFAFLSVQLVREDENPYTFNEQIHIDKITQLQAINDEFGGFFFGRKELKQLIDLQSMSNEEWSAYWEKSMYHHRIRQKALTDYLSDKSSLLGEMMPKS